MSSVRRLRTLLMHHCSYWTLILSIAVASIFHCEVLSHWVCRLRWANFDHSNNQVRVLLVADPQLVGIQDESQMFGFITRWDLDRYLRKTFNHAVNHVQPDVIVFLGDILDEGSKASNEEYLSYLERFCAIFKSTAKHVYIPGDNDVGGEGFDMKSEWKVQRFNRNFFGSEGTSSSVNFNWDFGTEYDGNTRRQVQAMVDHSSAQFRFLLNHMSILSRSRPEIHPLLQRTNANLVIVAHSHSARLSSCLDCFTPPELLQDHFPFKGGIQQIDSYEKFHFDLSNRTILHELMVPTCSYRMGVPHMGYAAAVVDISGDVEYSILWTPSRYPQLFLLLSALIVIILLTVIKLISLCITCMKSRGTRRYSSIP